MNIHYRFDGQENAPVLVLSNSLGTTLSMWDAQIPELTKYFRVLRYDTHGHGQTTKRGEVTLSQLGEDVITLLDTLNIPRAYFCGISMGGLTGLWLARFAPERFGAIVVANTAAKIGDPAAWLSRARTVRSEGMSAVAAGAAERWFTKRFCQHHPDVVAQLCNQLAQIDPEGYAECCEALADADLRTDIAGITLPLLILSGLKDSVTTTNDADYLQQQIVDAFMVELAASHLSNIEDREEFSAAIIAFFERYNEQ